jgi:hypothetical protein
MAAHGVNLAGLDVDAAFVDVRIAKLAPGEVLLSAASPPSFVYVPTGPGLAVWPAGGYTSAQLRPWVPVGTTGVVRQSERNSDIVAERHVEVVMIPGERYATVWFRPYGPAELAAALTSRAPSDDRR